MSNKTRTGWVYVLTNESIAGQVKVGFTSGHPEDRAKELHSSGVPTPYKVTTAFLFSDKAKQIEQKVHSMLKDLRVSQRREFFRCSGLDAADAIKEASNLLNEPILKEDPVLLSQEEIERRWRFKALKEKAEQGDAKDQVRLADCYLRGELGVEKNWKEAFEWFGKAADQQHRRSVHMVRHLLLEKYGRADLLSRCARLAKEGKAWAQYTISNCYYRGNGSLKQDYELSITYCRKAAEQGFIRAQEHLGFRYADGRGVKKDEIEAIKWYSKAAEQGSLRAQEYLKTKGLS